MKAIKIVIDTSVAVKWLNAQEEKLVEQADKILKDFERGKCEIFMPELARYEIGNALLHKKMTAPEFKLSLASFYAIPIKFVPEDLEMAKETAEIAVKTGMTYYDACFVTLAKKLGAKLVTDNPRHQGKFAEVKVLALKDY